MADDQITGYQVLKYQYTYVTRLQAWSQYVSKPKESPNKIISTIIDQLDDWNKYWTGEALGRVEAARKTQIDQLNQSQ